MSDDDIEVIERRLRSVFELQAEEFQLETGMRDAGGGWRFVFTTGYVEARDISGYPQRIVCHHVDITEHKAYERYKNLINSAPIGVFVTLASGPEEVIYTNDQMARMLDARQADGRPDRHAYRSKPLATFMSSEDVQRIRQIARTIRPPDGSEPERLTPKIVTKTGAAIDTHMTLVRDQWEGVDAWFFYVADVTEIHRREFELKQKNAELDAFAYTISHDLRAPLITIRNFLGYLQPEAAKHPKKQFRADFERIASAAEKLDILLQGILELSRVGRASTPMEEVSLRQEIERVKENLAAEIEASGVDVQMDAELPVIRANSVQVCQLFQNLIQNALKHRNNKEPHPYVRVGMTAEGAEWVWYVRDNGLGIDAASREKVFQIFTKLRKTTEGAGIGLSIVRRIVEFYGGRVWIESNRIDEKGIEVRFTLPKATVVPKKL